MLEFINNNGVLFSGIFGLITALVTAIVAIILDKRKVKNDTVKSLKKELANTKAELEKFIIIEKMEESIDKTYASVYIETLPNGFQRNICGYCWENNHTRIPLVMESYHSDRLRKDVCYGRCGSCRSSCYFE